MNDPERTLSANTNPPTTISSIALTVVSFALSRGLPFEALEEATGQPRATLIATDGRVPDDVAPRIWRLISEHAQAHEVPSLAMAQSAPFTFLGGLVEGAQLASTMGEALSFLVENRTIVADRLMLGIHHLEEANEVALSVTHPLDNLDAGRMAEVGTGLTTRVLSAILCAKVTPRRVEYAHPANGPVEVYHRYLKAPPFFERARTQVVFDRALLDEPVQNSNIELFRHVQLHYRLVRDRLKETKVPEPLRALHRAILVNANQGDYRAGAAAARAGLSVRSAQRLASANGRTLGGMIEAVRQANAQELLEDPSIPLASVALLAGYSDDRAFRRAFKSWTGDTPSGYRRKNAHTTGEVAQTRHPKRITR